MGEGRPRCDIVLPLPFGSSVHEYIEAFEKGEFGKAFLGVLVTTDVNGIPLESRFFEKRMYGLEEIKVAVLGKR